MKALILAAGQGTRLGALTAQRPKPMIEVGNRPLLAHLIDWLHGCGITEIGVNLHHRADVITGYFGDGNQRGVSLTYSYEPRLLGTAGAAKELQLFLDEPFVLVYGDVYTNLDMGRLISFHRRKLAGLDNAFDRRRCLTLSLYRVLNPSQCGLVDMDNNGRITRFVEKPPPEEVFTDLANAGMCVVEPGVLDYIPSGEVYDFGRDLFPLLLAAGAPLFGLPINGDEFLIDIGTPSGLARARACAKKQLHSSRKNRPA